MKALQLKLVLLLGTVLLSACAHHRDVRPGVDGVHRVNVRGEEKDAAERSAISQANHYCESTGGKHAAFVNEQTKYTGSMDEGTRATLKKASQAAQVVGTSTSTRRRDAYGRPVSQVNPLGTAGVVGSIMTSGQDYSSEMKFKCQ